MAITQVVVSGGVLFLLYRYLLQVIGAEQVGIWAIVLATGSASRISEMGFTGSAVKFTARYIARGEKNNASDVVQTTVITIGTVLAFVLVVGYPVIAWLMGVIVPATNVPDALTILPYALVSIWIGAVAGVFLSGLDGCQRADLRAMVAILATMVLLGLTWILVPRYGLVGLAWAQIGQGVSMLLASWMLLLRELPELPLTPHGWRYSLFREMFQYGVNFQVMSIVSMLFEPTTKALMAIFGGLTATAYYEMANRMVLQFRLLLVSANQVMVPQVATLQENEPEKIRKAYLDSYRVLFFLALPLFSGVALAAPLVSELWIGRYEQRFVSYSLLLVAGFWFNTLSGPAYFVNLGTGLLRWNTLAHVAIGILNVGLGYLLGVVYGGGGVVMGYVLALVIGSSLVILGFHRDHHIPHTTLFPNESKKLFLACCIGSLMGAGVFHFFDVPKESIAKAGLSFAISIVAISPIFWMHPLRSKIGCRLAAAFWRQAR